MNIYKLICTCCLATFFALGSVADAQQLRPQARPACSAATAKICPILNWPQFHFDSAHTGFNPYETVLSPATVGNLVLDWSYQALPYYELMNTSPAIFGGTMYFGGVGFGNVYAVNAQSGKTVWIWENNSVSAGSPAVAFGKVYETDGDRYAIHVFDSGNGHLLGNWGDGNRPSDVTLDGAAVYASSVHIGNYHTGATYALDANTGALLWERVNQSGNTISPAVANNRVFAECTPDAQGPQNLCAMDAATGDILWQFSPAGVGSFFQPAVSNGAIYVAASVGGQGYMFAVDSLDGSMLWQTQLPATNNPQLTTPAVANGVVYVGTADYNDDSYGYLYALDAETGAILWNYSTAGGIYSSAAVANGVVYFGSDDMNVYALDATTGARLWNYTTGGKVVASPVILSGRLYIGSEDYHMYAFRLPEQ